MVVRRGALLSIERDTNAGAVTRVARDAGDIRVLCDVLELRRSATGHPGGGDDRSNSYAFGSQ
jgi:hypothetical protein